MDKFDKKLKSIFKSNDFAMSNNFTNMIKETLSTLPNKEITPKNSHLKLVLATTCCLILISTAAFGKDIGTFFQGILSKGVRSAIENNFVEINDSEYSESKNTKAYIDSVLMDDCKLCICFKFELPPNCINTNITNVDIPNILIYDENENILLKHFFEETDYSFFNLLTNNEHYIDFSDGFSLNSDKEHNNIYSLTYVINGNNFPKSKNIYVKFNKINLMNKDLLSEESSGLGFEGIRNKSNIGCINGEWNLAYNLSEKTYKRENYIYEIINYDDYNYNFPKELVVSNTETRLKFSYDLRNISNGEDISNENEPYIKTENETLKITQSDHSYIGYKSECDYTFELSTFNSTPIMQLIIPIENGNEIILELKRK